MSGSTERPAVSIILPTYNRAKFLPQALSSIQSQLFSDWELIVVDDGSTDDTQELLADLTRGWSQLVRYHWQENQGVAGARNTGLDLASGEFVAFFDSDDVWLPHHLDDCVSALRHVPQLDWVYGACRCVRYPAGEIVTPSTFYPSGRAQPFLSLRTQTFGRLKMIDDSRLVKVMVSSGLYCGLQNSVIRKSVFEGRRFYPQYPIGEDLQLAIRAIVGGHRFGYFNAIHVLYSVHESNSSGAAQELPLEKRHSNARSYAGGYEAVWRELRHTSAGPMLRRTASGCYFWQLGNGVLWQSGRRREALAAYRRGLRLWPWDWRYWITYALAVLRTSLSLA
jgi:glycosyltransferase involved in cell wall biosynthesis